MHARSASPTARIGLRSPLGRASVLVAVALAVAACQHTVYISEGFWSSVEQQAPPKRAIARQLRYVIHDFSISDKFYASDPQTKEQIEAQKLVIPKATAMASALNGSGGKAAARDRRGHTQFAKTTTELTTGLAGLGRPRLHEGVHAAIEWVVAQTGAIGPSAPSASTLYVVLSDGRRGSAGELYVMLTLATGRGRVIFTSDNASYERHDSSAAGAPPGFRAAVKDGSPSPELKEYAREGFPYDHLALLTRAAIWRLQRAAAAADPRSGPPGYPTQR